MSGEEVIYHDVSPRNTAPPPQQIPSGAAAFEDEAPPKKGCSTITKLAIGSIVVLTIVLSVVLTRPGALTAFGRKSPAATTAATGPTYMPTYFPTYFPTYVPTYVPTDAPVEAVVTTTTVAATEAAATEAAIVDTNVTTEEPLDLSNITSTNTTTLDEEEFTANATATAATSPATTTTEITTTTTTEEPHPVCGNFTDYKVFKLQFTPSSVNATYSFASKDTDGTVYSTTPSDLPLDEIYEEKVCVPAGEYEFTMSDGACVNGYYRGNLILFNCAEGSITVKVEDKSEETV
mmetsp:Transcript_29862/g.46246  ORF Transcript_29862/g.46246 Transcript_29862/m.46246 type:complete len:291 (+) Transcript_29862:83-955(+)